jgi:TolB protein
MFGAVSGTDEPACHVLDLTTGSVEQVTPPGARHCAWSPEGTRIAFDVFDGAGGADVWVIGAGGDAVRLTTAAGIDMAPAFSADGTRIVFSSDRANEGGALDLWIMDADGTDPRRLTATETFDVFADWG